MGIISFKREKDESELQFLWRLGQAKDNGLVDLSWDEIADIMNEEFRLDESEYRSSAAYRKPYQSASMFYRDGVFTENDGKDLEDKYRLILQEIKKEKQKLSDERCALNRGLRNDARIEEDLKRLEMLIQESAKVDFPEYRNDVQVSDNSLIVTVADFHLGVDANNHFGTYNSDVVANRLSEYLEQIIKIKELNNSDDVYVVLLGDLLSGEIHFTIQLENRENVTEQIQKCAELLSNFVYELSKHFRNVYVNGIAGNHSRTGFKDQVLRNNRLDNLIPWYMKAKLSHINTIRFIDNENYDPTIGCIEVKGKRYLLVHGDFDSFSEKGVTKLLLMLDLKPSEVEAIFYGHLHRCSYDDIAGVKIIRSGSFSGTVDDYTISKRFVGKPSQIVCVVNKDGINACYPISLN